MRSKVEGWVKQGGDVHRLWASVRNAKKCEGVVHAEPGRSLSQKLGLKVNEEEQVSRADATSKSVTPMAPIPDVSRSSAQKAIIAPLQRQLESITSERDLRKKELEFIQQRERLLNLAIDRSKKIDECGWDERLCFGEDEWLDFGGDILESYGEDTKARSAQEESAGYDGMQVDGPVDEAVWWCREQNCERHTG